MRTGSRRAASKEALKQLQKITETELAEQAVETMILSDDDDVVHVSNDFTPSKAVCTCGAFAKSGNRCSICKTIYHTSCSSRKLSCCAGGTLSPTSKISSPYVQPRKRTSISSRTSEDIRDEIVIEEDVTEVSTPTQNLGVDNPALILTATHESLSPSQIAAMQAREREHMLMKVRIENLIKKNNAEIVYEGEGLQAFSFDGPMNTPILPKVTNVPVSSTIVTNEKLLNKVTVAAKTNTPAQTPAPAATPAGQSSVGLSFVVDPRSGQVVGTVSANSQTLAATSRKRRNFSSPAATAGGPQSKVLKVGNANPPPSPQTPQKAQNGNPLTNKTNTPKSTSVAAVVDLTSEDNNTSSATAKPSADTKEVAFNKIQGKTFPSLVVVARPNLNVPPVSSPLERSKLDMRVKSILVYQPSKFTEWLIQQGLVKAEQYCPTHTTTRLKLGMYSDAAKFPFSGGYVWISDCCAHKFISVYSGSIFEGSPHPPSIIIKLMYHWACQTNVQNVIQWVKVENLYVKGLYTWLRAVCTVGLHTHLQKLGGPGVKVEIGVISLGTTSQDGHQRQVKVEVLGILETETKRIRLRAIEPLTDSDRLYKKRFSKILEPLYGWVHPESTIVTDQTVDRATLHTMGFMTVVQTVGGGGNHRIMDYLRKIVPRMFQNTLSLLSRQIIQQFLDELVWREWFGTTPADAFDNIIMHLSEQTRSDGRQALMIKLNKVATNPFKNWSLNKVNTNENEEILAIPQSITETGNRKIKRKNNNTTSETSTLKPSKTISNTPDIPEAGVNLENYYFGTIEDPNNTELEKFNTDLRCHICKEVTFTSNLGLMRHYFKHAHSVEEGSQCHYCLASVSSQELLLAHIQEKHPSITKSPTLPNYMCVICAHPFSTAYMLGKHMSNEHRPSELPYQCGSCAFRSSSHKETVDHFHAAHNNTCNVQCPFCLKSSVVNTAQHLHYFFQHLQKHQRKTVAKRCKKCCLWFVQKDAFSAHINKMHESVKRTAAFKPWPVEHNGLMVPRSVFDGGAEEEEEVDISGVVMVDVPEETDCKECGTKMNAKHYEAVLSCTNENCQYVTCCKRAMDKHLEDCKGFNLKIPTMHLPFKMFCVCGYSDKDGNSMARHLAVCERTSAYPSKESATAATVTHSMLDVLGLVRRPEEQPNSDSESKKPDEEVKTDENSENDKEVETITDDADAEVEESSEKDKTQESENNDKAEESEDKEKTQDNDETQASEEKVKTASEDKASEDKVEEDTVETQATEDNDATQEPVDTNKTQETSEDPMEIDDDLSLKKPDELSDESEVNPMNILENDNDLDELLQVNSADLDCGKADDLAEMLLAN